MTNKITLPVYNKKHIMLSFGLATFEHEGKKGELVVQGNELELRYQGKYAQIKIDHLVTKMMKYIDPKAVKS